MTIALVTNLTYISTALAGLNEWTGDLVFLRRDIPRRWNASLASLDAELPPDAHPLLVGQAAVFHLDHTVTYNTVFDPEIIELLASGKSDQEFREALHERNLTHIYVDWKEIQRHRQPGGYGFTDFVQPDRGSPAGSRPACSIDRVYLGHGPRALPGSVAFTDHDCSVIRSSISHGEGSWTT